MKIKSFFIVAFLSLVFFNCKKEEEAPAVELITVEEMDSLLEMRKVRLIDVRTPGEYSEGYIEGAENIDFNADNFEELIGKVDKTKPVIIYCRSGGRSKKCSEYMKKAGFVKIYDLDGGLTEWKSKQKKIIK
ncbi:rhodanese-like domain-containing protein [Aquimarina aquimarini]|uniref:rhodanese-like domain-containing protein n=1 Tax=Aquimarina aquimarini TaxID=1191734 RepID=UPI000D5524DE|nr:rhodanese-like domain-containing protein [Aquimarina aquimarini]